MKYEQHPEGTGEVLRQLRAERELLTLQVEEQRRLLERAENALDTAKRTSDVSRECLEEAHYAITQHLKGKA